MLIKTTPREYRSNTLFGDALSVIIANPNNNEILKDKDVKNASRSSISPLYGSACNTNNK